MKITIIVQEYSNIKYSVKDFLNTYGLIALIKTFIFGLFNKLCKISEWYFSEDLEYTYAKIFFNIK